MLLITALMAAMVGAASPAPVPTTPANTAVERSAAPDRSFDLQLHPVLSFPNLLGLCLEAFPGAEDKLSVTTCASIGVIGAGPNVNLQYRWPVYRGNTLRLTLGPGVGPRMFLAFKQGAVIRPPPGSNEKPTTEPDEWGVQSFWGDAFVSLEAVWWGESLGFSAQLDLGGTMRVVEFEESEAGRAYPLLNFTVGLAFRN